MNNAIPYDLYNLDSYSLAYHSLARFKQLLAKEIMPFDVVTKLEDEIIPALEQVVAIQETNIL